MCKPKKNSGQGLVEFALILPILLLLVLGALDLGRAFFVKVVLENSAREGAYYMVYNTSDGIKTVSGVTFASAKAAVQKEAGTSGLTIPLANISVKCMVGVVQNDNCPSGSTVIVTVKNTMQFVINVFFNGPLVLTNDARMLIP